MSLSREVCQENSSQMSLATTRCFFA